MKKTLEQKITDKFEEYGIKVFSVDEEEEGYTLIMAENLMLSSKDKELFINFHICAYPSFSGRIMAILREVRGIKKIQVGDDFVFDDDGTYLEGEKAIDCWEEFQERKIIDHFITEQKTLYLLSKAEGYPC